MIDIPYTCFDENKGRIVYFSDTDLEYFIEIGHKCVVATDEECTDWIEGIVSDIKDDGFELDTMNDTKIFISYENIFDIHGKEELSTITNDLA